MRFPKEGTVRVCPECKYQRMAMVIPDDFAIWACECGYEACPYTMKEFDLCDCKNHKAV
jgi:hypothetical protein